MSQDKVFHQKWSHLEWETERQTLLVGKLQKMQLQLLPIELIQQNETLKSPLKNTKS